jgi:hypothetical protein
MSVTRGRSLPSKLRIVAFKAAVGLSHPTAKGRPAFSARRVGKVNCVLPFPSRKGWLAFDSARKRADFIANAAASKFRIPLGRQGPEQSPHFAIDVLGIGKHAPLFRDAHDANPAGPATHADFCHTRVSRRSICGIPGLRVGRLRLSVTISGIGAKDARLPNPSLCSAFFNIRSGALEIGSMCDGERFAEPFVACRAWGG